MQARAIVFQAYELHLHGRDTAKLAGLEACHRASDPLARAAARTPPLAEPIGSNTRAPSSRGGATERVADITIGIAVGIAFVLVDSGQQRLRGHLLGDSRGGESHVVHVSFDARMHQRDHLVWHQDDHELDRASDRSSVRSERCHAPQAQHRSILTRILDIY